jgi:hypothetical protein
MPQRVNELLMRQRGQLGNCNALKMWRFGVFVLYVVSLERAEYKEL